MEDCLQFAKKLAQEAEGIALKYFSFELENTWKEDNTPLTKADTEINGGDGLSTIESVKAVSDVYSPISGKVIEANEELTDAPQLINEDPYGKGWIAVIEISDESELKELLDAEAYKKLLSEEA